MDHPTVEWDDCCLRRRRACCAGADSVAGYVASALRQPRPAMVPAAGMYSQPTQPS
jgi:hypothetical protein